MAQRISARRRIALTQLELPVFGFGAAHIGELYSRVPEGESRSALQAAWDAGVRYFDTAPWYGRGLSEHRLGGFLRTQTRGEFQITTKVGRTLHRPLDPNAFNRAPWLGGLNFEVNFDYSRDGVMRSYEQALQRLALDSVDALVIHDLDLLTHGDAALVSSYERQLIDGGGLRALQELKSAGDILAYGMGLNTSEALMTTAQKVDLDFALVAMPYTLLDQSTLQTGMSDFVRRGVSVIIGAPFASGILVTGSQVGAKYAYGTASPEVQARVRGIEAVCAAHAVPLPAAALQFVLAHPAVVSVIPGAANASEIVQNVAHLNRSIPSAFWADLKTQGLVDPASPVPSGASG